MTVNIQVLEEAIKVGKRLGRHIEHDALSWLYAEEAKQAQTAINPNMDAIFADPGPGVSSGGVDVVLDLGGALCETVARDPLAVIPVLAAPACELINPA